MQVEREQPVHSLEVLCVCSKNGGSRKRLGSADLRTEQFQGVVIGVGGVEGRPGRDDQMSGGQPI